MNYITALFLHTFLNSLPPTMLNCSGASLHAWRVATRVWSLFQQHIQERSAGSSLLHAVDSLLLGEMVERPWTTVTHVSYEVSPAVAISCNGEALQLLLYISPSGPALHACVSYLSLLKFLDSGCRPLQSSMGKNCLASLSWQNHLC